MSSDGLKVMLATPLVISGMLPATESLAYEPTVGSAASMARLAAAMKEFASPTSPRETGGALAWEFVGASCWTAAWLPRSEPLVVLWDSFASSGRLFFRGHGVCMRLLAIASSPGSDPCGSMPAAAQSNGL